jgi:glutathione S-transferase
MAENLKPISIWGKGGPNPPKILILALELGIPHDVIPIPFSDIKKPEYVAINPNGRLPAIQDPNTGITVWESGAIIEYLIERYDTEHKLSFAQGTPEYYHAKQWLFYQTTGQGPYYGQLSWFKKFHPEKVPSAMERYAKEVNRVSGVLNDYLAQQEKEHGGSPGFDGPWLVGNKLSYADLSFVTWQRIVALFADKDEYDVDNFPVLKKWLEKMSSREAVQTAIPDYPSASPK